MMIISIVLLCVFLGALIYALSANPKIAMLGLCLCVAALTALMIGFTNKTLHL